MTTKDALHRIIDELSESELETAWRLLEPLRAGDDPVLRAVLNAPEDEEPLTADEIAAIEEAKERVRRGEYITWDELKKELADLP